MSNGFKLLLLVPLLVLCLDFLVAPFTGAPAIAALLLCGVLYLFVLIFPARTNMLGRSKTPTRDAVLGALSMLGFAGLAVCGVWAVL